MCSLISKVINIIDTFVCMPESLNVTFIDVSIKAVKYIYILNAICFCWILTFCYKNGNFHSFLGIKKSSSD